jgi:hypothetical protein
LILQGERKREIADGPVQKNLTSAINISSESAKAIAFALSDVLAEYQKRNAGPVPVLPSIFFKNNPAPHT